jgi:hypothetical protein
MLSIPSGVFNQYYEAVDWLINNNYTGHSCTLVYPPKKTVCENCTVNIIGGSSTNTYKHGGPAPFSFGNCPLCGGNGYHEEEVTGTLRVRIYWEKQAWKKYASVNIDDAEAMIIGYLSDLPNLIKANEIILINKQEYANIRMVLTGQPFPHGFGKDRYFIAFLKSA